MKKLLFLFLIIFISCSKSENNPCDRVTCSNNGKCIVENDKAKCKCDLGFYEDALSCKENKIVCEENFCKKNEKCIIENKKKKCICKENFHQEDKVCTSDKKSLDCIEEAPENASSKIKKIEITWNESSNSWNETPKCEWQCNDNYIEENNSCVLECGGNCKEYQKCENKVCILKENRCNKTEDCSQNMICDINSNFCFPAKKSWHMTPSANGFGALLYNENENKITTYYPHIYQKLNENSEKTPNLVYDVYFGIRINEQNTWLSTIQPESIKYIYGTGIIELVKKLNDIIIKEYYFMTMNSKNPLAVAGIVVENNSADEKKISVFSLGNFRVGAGNNHTEKEKVDYVDKYQGFYERNWELGYSFYHIFFASGLTPDVMSLNIDGYNPYNEIKNSKTLVEKKTTGNDSKSDVALFYQKNLGVIEPNKKSSYYVAWNAIKDANDIENIAPSVNNYIKDKTFENLLDEEKNYWKNWHKELPKNISKREKDLALQSAAFIKMGQVREDIKGKGQILASLPPGGWNIGWIRDMSYAVIGLIKSKHFEEALLGLDFIFGNNVNIGHYNTPDWDKLGHDYQISVCRYYGDGSEETDWNSAGPNIEYDGFGLALWMLDEYIEAKNNDTSFLLQYQNNIFKKTADVLLNLIESDNLISPDSSIWEYHWTDDGYNGKRHFAYTSITAYRGLKAAKRLGDLIGIDTSKYQEGLEKLKNGITTHLIKDKVLRNFKEEDVSNKSPENGQNLYNIDASSVEAFNFEIIDPNSEIATNTLKVFETELGNLKSLSPGFSRTNKKCSENFDGCENIGNGYWANSYDIKEWIMVDFRILEFLRKRTDKKSIEMADKLYNWILTQSELNNYQIAELYDEKNANYSGNIPMCGFGPGAFLIELLRK